MTQETNNMFYCPRQDSVEFERLPDGVYTGVCCGVVLKQFAGYEDKTTTENKLYFLFQVTSEGSTFYFKSRLCRPFIGERSLLFVTLNTWTGATLQHLSGGVDTAKLCGYPAQLVVVTKTSQKDGKPYQELANILKAPKGTKIPVTPDAIPEYLVRGALQYVLAEGLTVKPPKAAAAPAAATPFQGLGTPVATPAAAPVANQGLSVTQPALNPQATADPVVPEADDSEELPF